MLGELNEEAIEVLLKSELLGRIGCHADGVTYIVPVHYAYEAPYLYAHSAAGLKLDIMRKNPEVCFEVDKVDNYFNWQSVICWGKFEEIDSPAEASRAMQLIIGRIEPFLWKTEDAHPSHGITNRASDIGTSKQLVAYRVKVTKKTGRFENEEMVKEERNQED